MDIQKVGDREKKGSKEVWSFLAKGVVNTQMRNPIAYRFVKVMFY
jgi:hypothetical protein